MRAATLLACTLAFAARSAYAQEPSDAEKKAYADSMQRLASRLEYQQGRIELKGGVATLEVPAGFGYLDPQQAKTVLEDMWGNPDGDETLGMLFPTGVSPLADEAWGVVITFRDDGYVKDGDADKIDYAKVLKDMQADARSENKQRERLGYPTVELLGWAARPHYDRASHKLYWARRLKFGGAKEETLNYDVRALGRRGVLSLNAVGSMAQLTDIERAMTDVMGFVQFNEGHRYADFRPGADKVAAYGIAALVAGKLAAKAGLFKLILGALVAAKKLVVAGVVALAALVRKLFAKKPEPQPKPAG